MQDFTNDWRFSRSLEASAKFAERVDALRATLRLQDPERIARQSGATWLKTGPGSGKLEIVVWEEVCTLTWPELAGYDSQAAPLTDFQAALLCYYLLTADGTPISGRWVSFADLPDGRIYNTAFQGYSGDEIARIFGLDLASFQKACRAAGGSEIQLASASFIFQALPYVPLMVTFWLGDEDFPSTCKILFDESARHYLPIDACAILGSMLVRKLRHTA